MFFTNFSRVFGILCTITQWTICSFISVIISSCSFPPGPAIFFCFFFFYLKCFALSKSNRDILQSLKYLQSSVCFPFQEVKKEHLLLSHTILILPKNFEWKRTQLSSFLAIEFIFFHLSVFFWGLFCLSTLPHHFHSCVSEPKNVGWPLAVFSPKKFFCSKVWRCFSIWCCFVVFFVFSWLGSVLFCSNLCFVMNLVCIAFVVLWAEVVDITVNLRNLNQSVSLFCLY